MVRASYRIGRIFGVDIEAHWTLIALLIGSYLISLPSGSLFVFMLFLFVCVLIHELSHTFVAVRNRVKVNRILLLPMGGASIIDQIDMDPRVEYNIAFAGPLMSIFLGCLFGVLVVLAPPGALNQIFQFLFEINILLGIFNLLPAFPTDGGRVFRSYLELRNGKYKATMLTVKIGNVVLALIILGTLVYIASSGPPYLTPNKEIIAAWNLIIVFFLRSGSEAEKELVELRQHTQGMTVREVVSKHFAFVEPGWKTQRMYDTVRRKKIHVLITRLGGEYAFVNLLQREKLSPDASAQSIATKIPNIAIGANIIDALEKMEANEIGIAAVTSKGRLAGVVLLSHLQAFLSLHVLRAMKSK